MLMRPFSGICTTKSGDSCLYSGTWPVCPLAIVIARSIWQTTRPRCTIGTELFWVYSTYRTFLCTGYGIQATVRRTGLGSRSAECLWSGKRSHSCRGKLSRIPGASKPTPVTLFLSMGGVCKWPIAAFEWADIS